MSNLGKLSIIIPPRITATLQTYTDFHRLCLVGPTGTKAINLPLDCMVTISDNSLSLSYPSSGVMWGTVSQSIRQMLQGITEGFTLSLTLSGIGYKASCSASAINLSLGFSHEINVAIPSDIKVSCPNQTTIILKSNSKLKLSAFAHHIAAFRPSLKDRYKNKGVSVSSF